MPLDKSAVASPLSPSAYRDDLYALGAATINMEGRALVANHQQNLSVLSDPTGVGAAAAQAQSGLRDAADYYLQVVLTRLLGGFTGADGVSNLMRALGTSLATVTDPKEAQSLIAEVVAKMRDHLANAQDTARMARQNVTTTETATTALDEAIDKAVAALEGDDGEIAQARAAISKTEQEVFDAIAAIVKNSNVVGDGVKDLARYVLSFIMPGETTKDGKTDDKKAGAAAADAEGTKAKAKDEPSEGGGGGTGSGTGGGNNAGGEIEPFPVDSITTISDGVEGLTGAQQALENGNKTLNTQYQKLAALSSILAAAQAIRSQAASMNKTAEDLANACDATCETFATLTDAYDALATRAGSAGCVTEFIAELNAQLTAWTRFRDRISDIELVLTGRGTLFPPLAR